MQPTLPRSLPRTLLWVTGLGAAFYVLVAPPGLTWLDAGELGAAAAELGVAHPPGFPLYALFHKAIMLGLPIADVAFRGNLASAILAALAGGAVVGAARAWGAGWAGAVTAVLLLLAPLFALHATTIEVYSGVALWLAIALWLIRLREDLRCAVALAFWVGLAAGHHAELRLMAAVLLPLALWGTGRRGWCVGLLAAFAGASVIAYLPLRAAADPWRNWGDPSTASALWDHLMGTRIRVAYADQFGALALADLVEFCRQILRATPVLVGLAAVGIAAAGRRCWPIVACLAIDVLYASALNPMGLRDAQNGVPTLVALALLGALGLHAIWARIDRAWVNHGLAVAAVVCAVPSALGIIAAGHDRALPEVVEDVSRRLPPEALVFVVSDDLASSFAFAQVVEGARPDVAVIVRQHIWDPSSIEPILRRQPNLLAGWQPNGPLVTLEKLKSEWPVAWEWGVGDDAAARPAVTANYPLASRGIAGQSLPAGLTRQLQLSSAPNAVERLARFASEYGRAELAGRNGRSAIAAFEMATGMAPQLARNWMNLGTARAQVGDLEGAIAATQVATARDPNDRSAWVNLARFQLNARHPEQALEAVAALLGLNPEDADGLGLRGIIRANAGDRAGARGDLEAALRLDPNQPEARAALPRLK